MSHLNFDFQTPTSHPTQASGTFGTLIYNDPYCNLNNDKMQKRIDALQQSASTKSCASRSAYAIHSVTRRMGMR